MNFFFGRKNSALAPDPDLLIRSCEGVIREAEYVATAASGRNTDSYGGWIHVKDLSHLEGSVRLTGLPAVEFPEDEAVPSFPRRRDPPQVGSSRPRDQWDQDRLGSASPEPSYPATDSTLFSSPSGRSPNFGAPRGPGGKPAVDDLFDSRWGGAGLLPSATGGAGSGPGSARGEGSPMRRPSSIGSLTEAFGELRARFLAANRATNLSQIEVKGRLLRIAEEALSFGLLALDNNQPNEALQLLNLAMKACPSDRPGVIGRITMALAEAERRGGVAPGTARSMGGSGSGPGSVGGGSAGAGVGPGSLGSATAAAAQGQGGPGAVPARSRGFSFFF